MKSRLVAAGRGWQWIVDGFALFRKNPPIWIVFTVILFLIALGLGMIPVLGQCLFYLLSPVFLAGVMLGCKALVRGEPLELAYLFAGFRRNTSQLVTIGGIYLVGQIVIFGLMLIIGGAALISMFKGGVRIDPELVIDAIRQIGTALLIGVTLSLPLMMAVWFAPMLVVFHDTPPLEALKLSFFACLKNVTPFLVYGIVLLLLAVVAMLPFGLGLLVLIPTIFGSIYASYQDLFAPGQGAATPG